MCRQGRRAVDHQVSVVANPHLQPGQRFRRRTGGDSAVAPERAAVAGTHDFTRVRFPIRQASEMSAHGTQHVEAFLHARHENAESGCTISAKSDARNALPLAS